MSQRLGGIISFQVEGRAYNAKGAFTYNLGNPMRTPVIGSDGVHGYSETPQVAFIEGAVTDDGTLSLQELTTLRNKTVTVALANGKTIMLPDAYFAAEGTGNTEQGEIAVRFEAAQGVEV